MKIGIWLCLSLLLSTLPPSISIAADNPAWDYIEVTSGFEGRWTTAQSHATVERHDGHINITVFTGPMSDAATGTHAESPTETIIGTIDSDGKIQAVITYIGTDANPEKIEGQLTQHVVKVNANVSFLYENIIFPRYYNLIGLVRRVRQK